MYRIACVFAGCVIAVSLHAQDVFSNTTSARSQGIGGVYVPSASGAADALDANPAGLAVLTAPTLELSLAAVFAGGSFSNSTNSNASLETSPGAIPDAAFGMPIGHSRFAIGAGLIPDMGSVANWTLVDSPGIGGANYGKQKNAASMIALRGVAGVSFSLNPAVSVGATMGLDYNLNTLQAPSVFQSNPALAGLKTLLNLRTKGLGRNYSVGILASPSRKVQLGAAWKSRTVIDSDGTATGNMGAQLAALGLSMRPDFAYSARVRHVLPQSVTSHLAWRVDPRWLLAFQINWVNWKNAFNTQPVELTNGNNAAINARVGSSSLSDKQPLNWKDQIVFHGGFERQVTERFTVSGGYAHGNNPVPNSTLSPLTAGIMKERLASGLGYRRGRVRLDLAYSFGLEGHATVGQSALLTGTYNNSRVGIGTQALVLTTSIQF